jgi:hypothetical protein
MGRQIVEVIMGIFLLIGIFLFLNNYQASVGIIQTIASNSIQGIKVLQGR